MLPFYVNAQVYKCEKDGAVSFQDGPCDGADGTKSSVKNYGGGRSAGGLETRSLRIYGKRIEFRAFYSTVYVGADGRPGDSEYKVSVFVNDGGNHTYPTEGYFSLGGDSYLLGSQSDNPEILSKRFTTIYRPRSPGTTTVKFSIAGRTVSLPVIVQQLPISIGDSAENVIKTLGVPPKKSTVLISWPNTKTVHGIVYSDHLDDEICDYTAEHWLYPNKFPGAVIAVCGNKVQTISTVSPNWKIDSLIVE